MNVVAESTRIAVGVPRGSPPEEARVALVPSVVPQLVKSGLDVIEAIRGKRTDCKTIVLTGYGNIATAVTAVKLGATKSEIQLSPELERFSAHPRYRAIVDRAS